MLEKDVFNDINYTNKVLIAINKQKFFFIVEKEPKKLEKNITFKIIVRKTNNNILSRSVMLFYMKVELLYNSLVIISVNIKSKKPKKSIK